MTFDLFVLPVDRALTVDEASAEVDRLAQVGPPGTGHDVRLDPFIEAMERRYQGVRGDGSGQPPFEFDINRAYVFIGIGWSQVAEVATAVAEAAWQAGLAVYDPQRMAVGLPAPYADGPLTAAGVEPHVQRAGEALAAIEQGVLAATGDDDEAVAGAVSTRITGAGFRVMSPLGFEITPEIEREALADPLRMPSALQTPDLRAHLIADLASPAPGLRHRALAQLAAWDPDKAVAEALRPLLGSDDMFEAGQAAAGLARQRDVTDLPAVLGLLHRASPADGGSVEAMLVPLRAALDLAALAGPEIVAGVRSRARTWRGEPRTRRQSWEREFDRELEALLGDG